MANEKGNLRKYELMLIIKATLPDTQKKAALKKVSDLIVGTDGNVVEQNIWGKRFMAFPIKNHQEGYYVILNIELNPEHAFEFKRQLNISSDVLRYLLRSVDNFEAINIPSFDKKDKDRE